MNIIKKTKTIIQIIQIIHLEQKIKKLKIENKNLNLKLKGGLNERYCREN